MADVLVLIVIVGTGVAVVMAFGTMIWLKRVSRRIDANSQRSRVIDVRVARVDDETRKLAALPSRFQSELEAIRRGTVR